MSPSKAPSNAPTTPPTAAPSYSPSYSPSNAPTTPPTSAPSFSPTKTPSNAPTSPPTNYPTGSPSYSPSNAPTQPPSAYPSNAPSQPPSNAPSFSPSIAPTNNPTQPTTNPTRDPTLEPTVDPTNDPTADPTLDPTIDPTTDPTKDPTVNPTWEPTGNPTLEPTVYPTASPTAPTLEPTLDPTVDPTSDPTINPTLDPTADPTRDPTIDPTADPTNDPTVDPTIDPTQDPSMDPTSDPTNDPTADPTQDPTFDPTADPTIDPTSDPTFYPSISPSPAPTSSPSKSPTSLTLSPTRRPTKNPISPTTSPTKRPTQYVADQSELAGGSTLSPMIALLMIVLSIGFCCVSAILIYLLYTKHKRISKELTELENPNWKKEEWKQNANVIGSHSHMNGGDHLSNSEIQALVHSPSSYVHNNIPPQQIHHAYHSNALSSPSAFTMSGQHADIDLVLANEWQRQLAQQDGNETNQGYIMHLNQLGMHSPQISFSPSQEMSRSGPKRTGSPQDIALLMQKAKSASKSKSKSKSGKRKLHSPQISISSPSGQGVIPFANVYNYNPQQNNLSVPNGNAAMNHLNHLLAQNELHHTAQTGKAPPNSPNYKYLKKQKMKKSAAGGGKQKYGAVSQMDNDVDVNEPVASAFQFSSVVNAKDKKYSSVPSKERQSGKSVEMLKIKSPKTAISVGDQLSDVTTTVRDFASNFDESDLSSSSSLELSSSSSEVDTTNKYKE